MKKLSVISAAAMLAAVLATSVAHAAPSTGMATRTFDRYDKNDNGALDGEEVAAVRKDFEAHPKGVLAFYDVNKDGKLDDAEITSIKRPEPRTAEKKPAKAKPTDAASGN